MTPCDIDRVFGRSRLRMVTGDHVEVYREASLPGERRRYTKRFLATAEGDFREWTEREWRILARLVGHGIQPVPDVVQFDRGATDRPALVQTFDAGVTVDHWATLLPLERDGVLLHNVFEDCAHWWSLARHSLIALDAIHELRLVHLDLKADNICIPVGPPDFDPVAGSRSLHPRFEDITLIDFAFSLVSGERLKSALPIAAQLDYEYQSPRLLRALEAGRLGDLGPTRQLDWRCDLFSLAAMLWRYLPELDAAADRAWTQARHAKASALVRRLVEVHDSELPATRPHAELIALASEPLGQPDLRHSLQRGWTLAIDAGVAARAVPTPVTRIALPLAVSTTPVVAPDDSPPFAHEPISIDRSDVDFKAVARRRVDSRRGRRLWWGAAAAAAVLAGLALGAQSWLGPLTRPTEKDVQAARNGAEPTRAARPAITSAARGPVMAPISVAKAPAPSIAIESASPATEGAGNTSTSSTPNSAPVPSVATVPPGARAPSVASAVVPPSRSSIAAPVLRPAAPRSPVGEDPPRIAAQPAVLARPGDHPVTGATGGREIWIAAKGRTADTPAQADGLPSRATVIAQARVKALIQQQAEAARAHTVSRPPSPSGNPAYPWAVAGKPPPGAAPAAIVSPPVLPAAQASSSALRVDAQPLDFTSRASDVMVNHLPRLAQRAERLVSRVLFVASRSQDAVADHDILDAAASLGAPGNDPVSALARSPGEARLLDDAARAEYGRHGASAQAVQLQVRAFGADPLDPDIAGHLAFLLLRQRPAAAESARQLALHALTLRGSRDPTGHSEDWATLAIASALAGRERDARNAFLVSLAMAPSVDRQCRAAIDVFALYGERLRAPVDSMISSARASSRAPSSGACAWPARLMVGGIPGSSLRSTP